MLFGNILIKKEKVTIEDATISIVESQAKFYLEHLIVLLKLGNKKYLLNGAFGNYVIQNQIVTPNGAFDVELI